MRGGRRAVKRMSERNERRDAGLTLVELLVAMTLMIILASVTLSVVKTSQSALDVTRTSQDLNEEARQAINRMARDIRQARAITMVVNPDGPSFDATKLVAVRFEADFDGDGCINGVGAGSCLAYDSSNPEDITYCYQPSSSYLYIINNQSSTPVTASSTACSGGQPLLAGNVSGFSVEYRSNQYRYDLMPSDGVTTWRELDAAGAPVGNNNGALDVELSNVDSVVLNVTMAANGRRQDYKTQVDMRNVSQ